MESMSRGLQHVRLTFGGYLYPGVHQTPSQLPFLALMSTAVPLRFSGNAGALPSAVREPAPHGIRGIPHRRREHDHPTGRRGEGIARRALSG